MAIYNETNYTALFSDPYVYWNNSAMQFDMLNGNGSMMGGHIDAYCRIEGFDILLQLQIVQTVIEFIVLLFIVIYVSMYVMRYMTGD